MDSALRDGGTSPDVKEGFERLRRSNGEGHSSTAVLLWVLLTYRPRAPITMCLWKSVKLVLITIILLVGCTSCWVFGHPNRRTKTNKQQTNINAFSLSYGFLTLSVLSLWYLFLFCFVNYDDCRSCFLFMYLPAQYPQTWELQLSGKLSTFFNRYLFT